MIEPRSELSELVPAAAALRDEGHGDLVSFSKKVFIPLTRLCRDVCHYCTYAKTPRHIESAYMTPEEVLETARAGQAAGCKEALFTLGDKPELRYRVAREALEVSGFATTLEYVGAMARLVMDETGLLPHINAGVMSGDELDMLKQVSVSQGLMLESASTRLCEKGGPHYGSPDKDPASRLKTIRLAGQRRIPFTSGILIGIGETREERLESLHALHELHRQYGHIQEIIVQNFRAKPDTIMALSPEPGIDELIWTIAATRLIFGPDMNIQVPPNLNEGELARLMDAGINDWGGVSPVTPDFVNPEAPWPHLETLAKQTSTAGKVLVERLAVYPAYLQEDSDWLHQDLRTRALQFIDADGLVRTDSWYPGESAVLPFSLNASDSSRCWQRSDALGEIISVAVDGGDLSEQQIEQLFAVRGDAFDVVCAAADHLRREMNGDVVTYVVNRNINYTNVCYFRCGFCAFSKGKHTEELRGRSYDLELGEIRRRVREAVDHGATEVCLQGGIHPRYTGETYLEICRAIKQAAPGVHIHAFSPLEIWQGANTLDISVESFLEQLRDAGLSTLPGTAAEILDDDVRKIICPDKINTQQWLDVVAAAHNLGLKTTSTIMFGHVDQPRHWARHLLRLRELQKQTGGISEFVPLPFVHREAPIYLKGLARKGPSYRETILMHAVARLALHPHIPNIQTSWVKMGAAGAQACLNAGCNDLGGTLMNESISRAAGAAHGQAFSPAEIESLIRQAGRKPQQRSTLYAPVTNAESQTLFDAEPLLPIINSPVRRNRQPEQHQEHRHESSQTSL
ncbi:MAG: 5-amino-6-(D-ribitylamino)uracil--L-tyrosine 4-hydroxyphenyl transferase CofH [Woeseiaceae bacterium]